MMGFVHVAHPQYVGRYRLHGWLNAMAVPDFNQYSLMTVLMYRCNKAISISTGPTLAPALNYGYSECVAANSATGFDSLNTTRRTSAALPIAGVFLCLLYCYGGYIWGALALAGFLVCRSVNPCIAATPSFDSDRGSSLSTQGVSNMIRTLIAPINRARANAHRSMAYAALRSNSSLKVRLKRYNAHMQRARQLAVGDTALGFSQSDLVCAQNGGEA